MTVWNTIGVLNNDFLSGLNRFSTDGFDFSNPFTDSGLFGNGYFDFSKPFTDLGLFGNGYFDFSNSFTDSGLFGNGYFEDPNFSAAITNSEFKFPEFNFSFPSFFSNNTTKETKFTQEPPSSGISKTAYNLAMKGYENLNDKGNGYLGIVDPNTKTYYLYDMRSNKPKLIGSTSVKFGSGNMNTVANANKSGSHATLSGFTKVAEEYTTSKWTGIGRRFDGLEQGINDNARSKATVIHCTKGNSTWGCIGVTPEYKNGQVDNSATNDKIRRLFPKGTIMFTCPTNEGMSEYQRLSSLV